MSTQVHDNDISDATKLRRKSARKPSSLVTQFVMTGSLVMMAGMITIGSWITNRIQQQVTENAAQSTALLIDSFLSPVLQELADSDRLSEGPQRALQEMTNLPAFDGRLVAIKIWKPDGHVLYASESSLIGSQFPVTDSLRAAASGKIVSEFDDLSEEENEIERKRKIPLLEIYSPVRQPYFGKVIAVAEFYEDGSQLKFELNRAYYEGFAVVGATTLVMALALFGIVLRGNRIINSQDQALKKRIGEVEQIAAQNMQLRRRVQRASERSSEINENYLRTISADLHDGPAQLVGLAALTLDRVSRIDKPETRSTEFGHIRTLLHDAMNDIRNICLGLSLPEIEQLPISEVINRAVCAHANRTRTHVHVKVNLNPSIERLESQATRIAVYRFVQEGLNNSYQHGGGIGQSVKASAEGPFLTVEVTDSGLDDVQNAKSARGHGLGLAGLRERIESLGGHFSFERLGDRGSRLTMQLSIQSEDAA